METPVTPLAEELQVPLKPGMQPEVSAPIVRILPETVVVPPVPLERAAMSPEDRAAQEQMDRIARYQVETDRLREALERADEERERSVVDRMLQSKFGTALVERVRRVADEKPAAVAVGGHPDTPAMPELKVPGAENTTIVSQVEPSEPLPNIGPQFAEASREAPPAVEPTV